MKYVRFCFIGVALFLLAGCFQVETVVRVNPDGSGTVEERMLFSKKILAQFEAMMQGFAGEGNAKPQTMELFDPNKLKAQAESMGEGVIYISGEKVVTDKYSGYKATYAFTDINKLRLSRQNGGSAGEAAGGAKPPAVPILFNFTKGSPATLTIEMPKEATAATATDTPAAAPSADTAKMSEEEAKKLTELFHGLKFLLAIEVNGNIIETNAGHRDGNRLTLADFDLEKFGNALPQLEKLSGLNGRSMEEAKVLLKDFPGIKMEMNEKLKVVFGK
ncbi:MAG TPA: hypothetical protein VJ161_10200 [Geobacteraceae bacterium]|nr:hypothetical protein [Geobacteraceae bacterium]